MRFQSFEEMLSYWAERKENGPALIFDEHGKSSWSYAEFLRRVRERAEELRAIFRHQGSALPLGMMERVCAFTPRDILLPPIYNLFIAYFNYSGSDHKTKYSRR